MRIYFSGIGGAGIGPLAEIALDAGYDILGSDLSDEGLFIKNLLSRNVEIGFLQDGEYLKSQHEKEPIDWFVHTAAITEYHPELVLAKKLGIKTSKRDELLSHIIEQKRMKLIAVAGTHGKTSVSGLLVWVLKQLSIPISYSVGTTLPFGPSGKFDESSEYFVYECDEYDRNMLNFTPFLTLITILTYDHQDIYPTQQDYLDAFEQFGQQSRRIIAWKNETSKIFPASKTTLLDKVADLKIAGKHNKENASLIIAALKKLNIEGNVPQAIESFPGIDRRFERLTENIYSDYGHHPAEIAATLQMASELAKNITVIYQPHQDARQRAIKDAYTDCFDLAKKVYWLPTYLTRGDKKENALTPEELTKNLTNKKDVIFSELDEKLITNVKKDLQNEDLLLFVGAGPIDAWLRQNLAKITD